MTTELISIEAVQANPLAVFTTENGLDPYLAQIKAEVDSFVPDMSTDKGRKEIASFAHKIARSKTLLDGIGKDLKASIMEQPKLIDAERRRVRELLEGWQTQVRAPLTEYEEAEKARIAEIQAKINEITALPDQLKEHGASSEIIGKKIEEITNDKFDYQEVQSDADAAKYIAIQKLTALKAEVEQAEIEAKKAEAERIEAEKKAQAEREAKIKAEAEAKAKADAEAAIKKAEQEKLEAQQQAKEAEERAKKEAQETLERVKKAQIEAEERAEREKQAAVKAEKDRIAKEAQEKADAEARRQANENHRRKINREALDGLVAIGISQDQAKEIITAIAKNEIPNISINY